MGTLEPVNMPRIIEDLERVAACISCLCGLHFDVSLFAYFGRDVQVPEFNSERWDEWYGYIFDHAWDELQLSRRRLSVLLNEGDVSLLDTDRTTRMLLETAWYNVCRYPDEKPEFDRRGVLHTMDKTSYSIESLVRYLKGIDPRYIGKGRVDITGRIITLRNHFHIACLEYLVEHRRASRADLVKVAHVSNPSKTVRELREYEDGVLAPYITTPGKSKMGYSTAILDTRSLTIT